MTESANPSLELLLTEAAWLRRIARHLVRDPTLADDVVQETWIRAAGGAGKRRFGESARSRRSWLARVAKNAAGDLRRGDSRRAKREERASELRPADEVPTPEELGARMELQQRVAEALLQLREPFRTTLYLLYYEGRSPSEIAAQLGESPATIRTRAHRGRELLRAGLVQEGRDWSEWAQALAPLAGLTPKGALSTPAQASAVSLALPWVMGTCALAAGLALVVGAWWALPASEDLAALPALEAAPEGAFKDPVASEGITPMADPGARVVQDPAEAAPMEVLLTGSVTQADGTGLGNAALTLLGSSGRHRVLSDHGNGSWALPGVLSGRWRVTVEKRGFRTQSFEMVLPPERLHAFDVQLEPKLRLPVRFVQPDGTDLVGFTEPLSRRYQHVARPIPPGERRGERGGPKARGRRRAEAGAAPKLLPRVVVTDRRPGKRLAGWDPLRPAAYGLGKWSERKNSMQQLDIPEGCQGTIEVDAELPAWFSLVYGDRVLESRRLDKDPGELRFEVSQEDLRAAQGSIQFEVRDPITGQNLSQAYLEGSSGISIGGNRPPWVGLEDGRVTVYDLAPGVHRVHFGITISKHERLSFLATVQPGAVTLLEPVLQRPGRAFEVRVTDASGAPLKAQVFAMRKALAPGVHLEHWSGFGTTDAGGKVRIPTVAEGDVWVVVRGSLPDVWVASSLDTRETTELSLTLPPTTPVRFQPKPGPSSQGYELLTEEGVPLNTSGLLYREVRLAQGTYRIRRRDRSDQAGAALAIGNEPTTFDLAEIH